MDEQTDEKTQNMLDDHLFQCRISPWPKTAEKRGFCTCVAVIQKDGRTDGRTNGQTDGLKKPVMVARQRLKTRQK